MAMSRPSALLVTSIGNPPPLHRTRHSAGHILLGALAAHLRTAPFQHSKAHAGGQVTRSGNLTLWQSPTLMNLSGPAILRAWNTFVKDHGGGCDSAGPPGPGPGPGSASTDEVGLGLVVLHDELESRRGTLRIRYGVKDSVKGHNGLKSVMKSLAGGTTGLAKVMDRRLMRVGVGIGRPVGGSRGPREVSDYVLGKVMVGGEMEGIQALVGDLVEELEKEARRIAEIR